MRSFLSLLVAASAIAQVQPTQGLRLPAPSLVGDDDPTALETNPASLPFSRSGLALVFDQFEEDAGGDAIGAFGSLGLGSVGTGISYQSLERNGKLTFGLGFRGGRKVGLGFGFHWYNSDEDAELNNMFATDLGLSLRPAAFAALGFVIRNLNTPPNPFRVDPSQPELLERVYDLELGIRPFGFDALELAGGARIGEDSEDVDPHFRASLSLWGIGLRGDIEVDEALDASGNEERDVRATAGLALNLERVGLFGGAAIRRAPGAGTEPVGAIVGLRLSEERYQPLPVEPHVFEEIVVEGEPREYEVVALLAHLAWLERDDRTHGVILRIGDPQLRWAVVEELRTRIARLRDAGKPVYAFLDGSSLRSYWLATAADRVMIGPAGGIQLVGIHANLYFYKGLLDWIGVRPDILRIAEYKSAPETFTEKGSTGPAREAREALLDDVYGRLVQTLADARRKDRAAMAQLIDQGPYTAKEAVSGGLVDEVVAPEDLGEWLERAHGNVAMVPADRRGVRRPGRWSSLPRIAVIVVEGDLIEGESRTLPLLDEDLVGGGTIAQAIRSARESDVAAIVVRVNSPGGMAGAADRIWREIYKTRGKKPIIASLGGVAASGGYYLASAADHIYASPSTVTGSIGIFFGKVDISGLLAKLGITHESYERGARAAIGSELRPYTDEERDALMDKLRQFYDRFREAVSKGRGLSMDDVDRVGRGRIWTGNQAKEKRLVDSLGGLEDAIAEAKRRAGMAPDDPVDLVLMPTPRPNLAQRIAQAILGTGEQKAPPLGRTLTRRLRELVPPSLLEADGEPMARADYELRLE